jgi:hypothetical protein
VEVVLLRDLQYLSGRLLEAMAGAVADQGRPTWLRLFDQPDAPDGVRFEVSPDPETLMGWVAPDDCVAVGVIATGRLRAVDDISGYTATGGHGPAVGDGRIEMACLVGRDGTIGWTVRSPGVATPPGPPTAGRMLDSLRRCFALPTEPPPVDPAHLMATAWLVSILEKNTGSDRNRLTWSEVSRLHPLARVLAGDLPPDCPDLVPGLCRLAASAWTWEDYRVIAGQDECLADLCEPELAAWMDEGMFARWILSALPAPEELLVAVRPCLVPSAARRLAHAIHGTQRPMAGSVPRE